MKRTNMVLPSPSTPNDTAPQGRYKSVILHPRHGTRTSSNSKLSPGYLRTFGFDNSGSSSQLESSKPTEHSNPQPAVSGDETAEVWSPDCDSLPPPPTTPPPPLPPPSADDMREENFLVLSESHLNVLSHNLSEIADRISPSTYDPMIEIDEESLEVVIDENIGHAPETVVSNSEQPTRFKTPYSRQRRDSKTYVSKQKSFTRKRSSAGRNDSHREMNNNGEISVDASNVLNFSAGNVEGFRQDSESDSGYSSSMSTSISLNEEIEAVKRHSSSTDVDADDLTFSGDDNVRKGSADNPVMSEFTGNSTLNQNTGNIKKRLDSLINGASSGIGSLNLSREVESSNTGIYSQTATVSNGLGKQSASFKLPVTNKENIPTVHKEAKELAESQSNLQKQTLDDTALPRTKTGRRPGLQRRRTTAMSFRPPKQITVHEGESDTVEMDEAGFVQMLTDFKSLKTQLLKLKRELQEADVVSPLMHPHSSVTRSGSFSMEYTDPTDRTPLHRKQKMLLHRTMTMDSATMKEKLCRTSSASSTGGGLGNLNDIAETIEAGSVPEHWLESNTADEKEINNLHKELEDVKERLSEITEERNSLMIAREELEHELDSKNHTIRMLQKQLESQTDSQDEMAYLKRQVKLLTNQIQQQQQKITELRYRESSPGPVHMGAKKEAVKADIRNRLRDAFVKHLGESSKSNVQLSKYIQKAEQNISMAQKGLSSLYSSPHASTEHLPKDKSRPSLERSDSQSSVERSQEDSDGREYESDSSRCSRRGVEGSRANRNNEDSGSESGKSTRRRGESLSTVKSQDESDEIASDSDSGKSRRRRTESLPFECNTEEIKRKDSKTGEQIEASDAHNRSKPDGATPLPYVRKLSRSKLLNKIEASPLSHSWTPSAIEKIVKSWRETKSPASQEKKKEEEKTLKPVSHVQFL